MSVAPTTFTHLPTSAHGLVLSELFAENKKSLLYIATNDAAMEQVALELAFFASGARVLTFPAWDVMPYDRISPKTALMAERMQTLAALAAAQEPYILLTTVASSLQKLPPKEALENTHIHIQRGQHIPPKTLIHSLSAQGYSRVGKAMEPGEFAVRGSIIDVIPAGGTDGIRLDWFGDEVESIKRFDVMTQITSGATDAFTLTPTSEVLLGERSISLFRTRYREMFGITGKEDALYEAISQGVSHSGMEHYLPLFYEETATIFDYAKGARVMMDGEAVASAEERMETTRDYYEARISANKNNRKSSFANEASAHPVPPEVMFIAEAQWKNEVVAGATRFSSFSSLRLRGELEGGDSSSYSVAGGHPHPNPPPQAGEGAIDLGIRKTFPFTQGNPDHTPFDQLKEKRAAGRLTIIACVSNGSRERLQGLLMERGFHVVVAESWQEAMRGKGNHITLVTLPIDQGFETPNAIVLSEQDVLGERIARTGKKKKTSAAFFSEAASFNEGDVLVHREHGIGRFAGLITLEVSGAKHDCLKLLYDGDDKLFLPVENIDVLSRFGLEEDGVKLDKLGGASWQARKAKLKNRISIAAEALLKIAAERMVKQGIVIEKPVGTYDEFAARFGFVETEDQARAIEDVLADLESGKPMDRLICGDVGFGKTEVALRAAFVVTHTEIPSVAEGSFTIDKDPSTPPATSAGFTQDKRIQVALICPTTLLARQHYKNFKARFAGFPVEVRQLSRMVPAKAQKQTLADIKEGKVDIVIGTHALLASGVEFKNLGLLIVDEEQHFGVAQKEKLKAMCSHVHVLTLSATPIPRTLQMAMTGIRDLSLITTPPIDRLAIRSFVMPFDPVAIREAVMRELHRGGQCFIVTPRIKHIAELRTQLAELLPEAKICVAHGQMAASELDGMMNDFYDAKYNVLLSTAIIESGLDIPTANTIIIHNAHLFGLSQLYQMRGRVGRAKTRAYAYFMLPHKRELTANATRRLEIMQTLDTLGAGFTLASHDMDIRGFGNLVGEEQSGHIREVGIELYQQMLEEAVSILRRGVAESAGSHAAEGDPAQSLRDSQDYSPTINLSLSVLIPEHYISDLSLRMGLYRRASALAEAAEIESFAAELIDRFGPMPEETAHLITVLQMKLLCKKAGIERIDVGPKGAVISFFQNAFARPDALIAFVTRRIVTLKIRPDQKLFLSHDWKSDEDKITTLKKLTSDIAALVV